MGYVLRAVSDAEGTERICLSDAGCPDGDGGGIDDARQKLCHDAELPGSDGFADTDLFGSLYKKGAEISLVFLVSAIGLGWNLLLMWLFTSPSLLGLPPMVSKIMASAIVTVWNYVSRKKWIFS